MASNGNKKKQDEKLLKILRTAAQLPGNKQCFDCSQRGPTYVNVTIGSFVCTKCSGMLRGLTPPHRVKSISMATFTPEEVEFVKNRGNDFCRKVWLALYDESNVQNTKDEQSVLDFMINKYERKRYYVEPSGRLNGPVKEQPETPKTLISPATPDQEPWAQSNNSPFWPVQSDNGLSTLTWPLQQVVTTQPASVKPPQIPLIQAPKSTMSLAATTNMFTPDRPDTFKFPPASDVFGPAPAPTANSQSFFANFENNPAFDSPPAPVTNLTNSASFPSALRPPAEDKYAALKALDSMMKMQNEPIPHENQNGGDWAPSGNPFADFSNNSSAPPPAISPFNPFRNTMDAFGVTSSHSMSFPLSWNSNNVTVGMGKSGNPFL